MGPGKVLPMTNSHTILLPLIGGPVPSKLNEVSLPVIRNDECQRWFNEAGHHKVIKPEFFCAGYKEGRKDSCEVSMLMYYTYIFSSVHIHNSCYLPV